MLMRSLMPVDIIAWVKQMIQLSVINLLLSLFCFALLCFALLGCEGTGWEVAPV